MKPVIDIVFVISEHETKWAHIRKPLDIICDNLTVTNVQIENHNEDEWLLRKAIGYLENHGINVFW